MASYHIYIHMDEVQGEGSAMADTGSASTGSSSGGDGGAEKIANKLKSMVSFAAIKSTADQLINYRISTISLRTGATEYEERASARYSAVSQAVGAGMALIAGGLVAGPAGVAVAALGIAANGISKAIVIAQRSNTLALQESVENVSIGMQNVRAGTVGRRGNNQ